MPWRYFTALSAMSSPNHLAFARAHPSDSADVDEQRREVDRGASRVIEAAPPARRSAIRLCRSTCSIGWPKPRSMPRESAGEELGEADAGGERLRVAWGRG